MSLALKLKDGESVIIEGKNGPVQIIAYLKNNAVMLAFKTPKGHEETKVWRTKIAPDALVELFIEGTSR